NYRTSAAHLTHGCALLPEESNGKRARTGAGEAPVNTNLYRFSILTHSSMQNCGAELLHDKFVQKQTFPQQASWPCTAKLCLFATREGAAAVTLMLVTPFPIFPKPSWSWSCPMHPLTIYNSL